MSVVDHLEEFLGEIDQGWADKSLDRSLQILSFRDCPGDTMTTYASLGLSDHILHINDKKKIRQEIIFSVYSMTVSKLIVSFLLSLCEAVMGRGEAILRGEVIPLSEDMSERIGFDAIYCAIPVLFDDEFSVYRDSDPPTVFVWFIPIYKSELEFIEANGWESFEDLLVEKGPDLCALDRVPTL